MPDDAKKPPKVDRDGMHRRAYLDALDTAGIEGPAWEDLTDEQRENVRKANHEYWNEMHAFGASLAGDADAKGSDGEPAVEEPTGPSV